MMTPVHTARCAFDDKKLEFVALLLSRDENILFYDKEAVKKKAKAAILVYDTVMEEIGKVTPPVLVEEEDEEGETSKSRYPWHEAPTWANWAATDVHGASFWYSQKPEPGNSMWCWKSPLDVVKFRQGTRCIDWRNSLEARPNE